jgi:diacylglycerol kinase family enzyme
MHSGPGASLSDGLFTIFVVREMSRIELLQMLIGADNGEHIFHPKVGLF